MENNETNTQSAVNEQQDVQAPTPAIRQRLVQQTISGQQVQSQRTVMVTSEGSSSQSQSQSVSMSRQASSRLIGYAAQSSTAMSSASLTIGQQQQQQQYSVSQQQSQSLSSTASRAFTLTGSSVQQAAGFSESRQPLASQTIAGLSGDGSPLTGLRQTSVQTFGSSSQRSSTTRVLTTSGSINSDSQPMKSSSSFRISSSSGTQQTITRSVVTRSSTTSSTSGATRTSTSSVLTGSQLTQAAGFTKTYSSSGASFAAGVSPAEPLAIDYAQQASASSGSKLLDSSQRSARAITSGELSIDSSQTFRGQSSSVSAATSGDVSASTGLTRIITSSETFGDQSSSSAIQAKTSVQSSERSAQEKETKFEVEASKSLVAGSAESPEPKSTGELSPTGEGEKKQKSVIKKLPSKLLRKLSKRKKSKGSKQTTDQTDDDLSDRAASQASAMNPSFEPELSPDSADLRRPTSSQQKEAAEQPELPKPEAKPIGPPTPDPAPRAKDAPVAPLSKDIGDQQASKTLQVAQETANLTRLVRRSVDSPNADDNQQQAVQPTESAVINMEPTVERTDVAKSQSIPAAEPKQTDASQLPPEAQVEPEPASGHQNDAFQADEEQDNKQSGSSRLVQSRIGPDSGSGSDSNEDLSSVPILKVPSLTANYNTTGTLVKGSNLLDNGRLQAGGSSLEAADGGGGQHPVETIPVSRPYPKKVFFIVVNEFCERFSYYGLRAVLVLYLRSVLGFTEPSSVVAFHLFSALCYMTPIMGAILADSCWGKFKTIVYLSIVYLAGELLLFLSSVFWKIDGLSLSFAIMALLLIGIGTGGIKPCVSMLGGEQFYAHEVIWRQTFFTIFYGAINVGALASTFITPLLRSRFQCVDRVDCYPFAFAVPLILMLVAIIVFVAARRRYYQIPLPSYNVITAFGGCVFTALGRKLSGTKAATISETPRHRLSDASVSDLSIAASDHSTSDNLSSDNQLIKKAEVGGLKSQALPPTELMPIGQGMKQRFSSDDQEIEPETSHWLYLAADKYDTRKIEDFRLVLAAFFVMVPLPLYWTLFNQQASLWTLQASRMDGRLFGGSILVEPDQMGVLNPLFLLLSIPLFEIIIFPLGRRYNFLTTSVSRITAGGFLAAVAFLLSALIEWRIQQFVPATMPAPGESSLLLVNGINGCSMSNCSLSYIQMPANETSMLNQTMGLPLDLLNLGPLEALQAKKLNVKSDPKQVAGYKLVFRLKDAKPSSSNGTQPAMGCPLNLNTDHELLFEPIGVGSVKLVYLQQGNGKLSYKMFDDNIELPEHGQALVRLLYEFFGSASQAIKPNFYLDHSRPASYLKSVYFSEFTLQGQVVLSKPLELEVGPKGEDLVLRSQNPSITKEHNVTLLPGTSNLILVHQSNASDIEASSQMIQDNDYRISMMWQIAPYLVISMSEVLFSITTLEFAYSIAPQSMRSLVSATMSLTTAFGDLITVALESLRLFPNQVHNYIFYAILLAVDMLIFAYIGKNHVPRQRNNSRQTNN